MIIGPVGNPCLRQKRCSSDHQTGGALQGYFQRANRCPISVANSASSRPTVERTSTLIDDDVVVGKQKKESLDYSKQQITSPQRVTLFIIHGEFDEIPWKPMEIRGTPRNVSTESSTERFHGVFHRMFHKYFLRGFSWASMAICMENIVEQSRCCCRLFGGRQRVRGRRRREEADSRRHVLFSSGIRVGFFQKRRYAQKEFPSSHTSQPHNNNTHSSVLI